MDYSKYTIIDILPILREMKGHTHLGPFNGKENLIICSHLYLKVNSVSFPPHIKIIFYVKYSYKINFIPLIKASP